MHCKYFVCRNRRRLSAIQIQKQTLAKSTDICVWLITNIFMLFLSKFSCWIYWKIFFVLILQIFVCDFGKYFSWFPNFLSFYAEYDNYLLFLQISVCDHNIFQKKSQNSYFDVEATNKCLSFSVNQLWTFAV